MVKNLQVEIFYWNSDSSIGKKVNEQKRILQNQVFISLHVWHWNGEKN